MAIIRRGWQRASQALWLRLDQQGSREYRRRPVLARADLFAQPAGIRVHQFPAWRETVHYPAIQSAQTLPEELTHMAGITEEMLPFVIEISDGALVGRHAVALTQSGQIVLESAAGYAPYIQQSSFSRIHYPRSLSQLQQQISRKQVFDQVASVVNLFSAGFYHWMLEGLPRLHSLSLYAEQTGINPLLLIDPDPPHWMLDSLHLLGYQADQIQTWDVTRAQAKHLLIPWMANASGHPSPTACRWVSAKLRQSAGRSFNTPRIYLSRADADKRRVINEAEVIALLARYGFAAYTLSDLSLADQTALFSQAQIVVGPHGAGFANLIHSQSAAMIEFFEASYVNACFYRLASGLGHHYRVLMAESAGGHLRVDLSLLEQILTDLLLQIS